jgi:hypothetical protein
MKNITVLLLSIFLSIHSFAQKDEDLLYLKKELFKRKYLFANFKKKELNNILNIHNSKKEPLSCYIIDNILSNFKEYNLKTVSKTNHLNSFRIKFIDNKMYIEAIDKKYSFLLEEEILKINNIFIYKIKDKLKKTFYLPHQKTTEKYLEKNIGSTNFLNFLNLSTGDSIQITTNKFNGKIPVNSNYISKLTIEKTMFSERNKSKWFWSYGINFGQQVFLKFNKFLSSIHIKKMKDSLKWSNYKYAKTFKVPLQQTYNPLVFTSLTNKLHASFSKNRYKKLIIDLRNTNIGTDCNLSFFIKQLKQINRLKKRNSLYILINKYTDNASIKYIEELRNNFNTVLIGETVYGTNSNSDNIEIIQLPISKIKISIPKKHEIEKEIIPDIKIAQTLKQTIKGIDAALNKALE